MSLVPASIMQNYTVSTPTLTKEEIEGFKKKAQQAGYSDQEIADEILRRAKEVSGGTTDNQITNSLVSQGELPGEQAEVIPQEDPFGGKTKREVLMRGLKSGLSRSQLEDVGKIYDLIHPATDDWDKARQFIEDNPEASSEELTAALRENTSLDAGDITALVGESGALKKEDIGDLSEEDMKSLAIGLVKEKTGLFTDSKKGKEDAIAEVKNDKTLTKAQQDRILALIEEEYPGGRSLLQKILPFGK